jgi:hypothetical protein
MNAKPDSPKPSKLFQTPTYGVELEKTFVDTKTGNAHAVGESYFQQLTKLKRARGEKTHIKRIGDTAVGVHTPWGDESLDNAFTLGESATGPVREQVGGLNKLHAIISRELRDVQTSLAKEGGAILNMSNHPLTRITTKSYQQAVPKQVYTYLRNHRGWNHMAGINAKSQNSPSVGVDAGTAVDAVNVILAFGAGLVALYANSPFEEGRLAGVQESRLALWPDMFGSAHSPRDTRLHMPPEKPFKNLREYFQWMFARDSHMFSISDSLTVKEESPMITIDAAPTLLEYLRGKSWKGHTLAGGPRTVHPTIGHFESHQFLQFTGARVRFGLDKNLLSVHDLVRAMDGPGDEVEQLFARAASYLYIEGRDPGAAFADREIAAQGGAVANSVVLSPTAIQAGLIRNLQKSSAAVNDFGWQRLQALREAAIKDGLRASCGGLHVRTVCDKMLALAAEALRPDEQWMLAYPEFVLRTGQNGADRALAMYDNASGTPAQRIRHVIKQRAAITLTPKESA